MREADFSAPSGAWAKAGRIPVRCRPAVGPGDTVWVADGMSRRYSIFGPDGTFVIPETSMVDAGQAIDVWREDGVFLGRLSVPATVKLTPKGMVHATEDYMLFAGEDDAGTPYVTRLRIRR